MTDGMDRSTLHLAAGLSVGLTGLAAGYTIGIVGDAVRMRFLCGGMRNMRDANQRWQGVRAYMQQSRVYVGMILILIFGEVLGLYG